MQEIIERLKKLSVERKEENRLPVISFVLFLGQHPVKKDPDIGLDKKTCEELCEKLDQVLAYFRDIYKNASVSNYNDAKPKAEEFKRYCQEAVIAEAQDYYSALLIAGIRRYGRLQEEKSQADGANPRS